MGRIGAHLHPADAVSVGAFLSYSKHTDDNFDNIRKLGVSLRYHFWILVSPETSNVVLNVRLQGNPQPVALTATEYELLRVLSLNAGLVSTYDALLRRVWAGRGHADAESVRVYIKRLRRKLGDDAKNPTNFFNQRGIGYRMARSSAM